MDESQCEDNFNIRVLCFCGQINDLSYPGPGAMDDALWLACWFCHVSECRPQTSWQYPDTDTFPPNTPVLPRPQTTLFFFDTALYNIGLKYPLFLRNKNALVLALIKFRMYRHWLFESKARDIKKCRWTVNKKMMGFNQFHSGKQSTIRSIWVL